MEPVSKIALWPYELKRRTMSALKTIAKFIPLAVVIVMPDELISTQLKLLVSLAIGAWVIHDLVRRRSHNRNDVSPSYADQMRRSAGGFVIAGGVVIVAVLAAGAIMKPDVSAIIYGVIAGGLAVLLGAIGLYGWRK